MSPLRRAIFYNTKILRRKKHKMNQSEQFTRFSDWYTINGNAFCFIFPQMHIDFMKNPFFFQTQYKCGLLLQKNRSVLCLLNFYVNDWCRSHRLLPEYWSFPVRYRHKKYSYPDQNPDSVFCNFCNFEDLWIL